MTKRETMMPVWPVLGVAAIFSSQIGLAAGVVAIYPSPSTLTPGASQQFTIYNTTGGSSVTWSVNGVAGGNVTYGTITTGGLYKAPATVPAQNMVTIKATSSPTGISGSSAMTLTQPVPQIWSTYPSTFTAGSNQSFSLNGASFTPTSIVNVNGVAWSSMFINSTTMKATGNLPSTGTFP